MRVRSTSLSGDSPPSANAESPLDPLGLARRLEMADAMSGVELAATLRRLGALPEATSLAVGGGYATFAGSHAAVSQAFGLGLHGPVAVAELDRLEDFFHSRRVASTIEVASLADRGLAPALTARGYSAEAPTEVLVQRIGSGIRSAVAVEGVTVRRAGSDEVGAIIELVAKEFSEEHPLDAAGLAVIEAMFKSAISTVFAAEVNGVLAGGGLLTVLRRVGGLSGAATTPRFRGRGVQRALLEARVAAAGGQRCDLAMMAVLPGSVSHRNASRAGFGPAYTRIKYTKPVPS